MNPSITPTTLEDARALLSQPGVLRFVFPILNRWTTFTATGEGWAVQNSYRVICELPPQIMSAREAALSVRFYLRNQIRYTVEA